MARRGGAAARRIRAARSSGCASCWRSTTTSRPSIARTASDPLLGRIIRARPKLRVLRKPEPFEALAWAVIEQLIDTQRPGNIAWAFTRAPRLPATRAGRGPRRRGRRSPTRPRSRRPGSRPRRRARWPASRAPASTAADRARLAAIPGIGEWTLAHLDLFGFGRYDVPLAKDVGMRNAYARVAGVRTGSVTEDGVRGGAGALRAVAGPGRDVPGRGGMAKRRRGGQNHRMPYAAAEDRYDHMPYRRCGRSGIKLPAISLGLWNRFGDDTPLANQRAIIRRAFDLGITHIDLANNYGPPYGSAEINFGRILREDLRPTATS